MQPGNRIGIRLALELVAYHRDVQTPVEDGDLGFRCPACDQPLSARPSSHERPAHFAHVSEDSTCRWAHGSALVYAARSELLARYFTPRAVYAASMRLMAKISDDRDDVDYDGDARVPSPLRSAPSGRSSSASVPEPEDDCGVAAVAEFRKGFHARTS
jgi:hypothetical protein